jgi:hypothetical protein
MNRLVGIGFCLACLSITLLLGPASGGQGDPRLDAEWLAKDREVVAWLVGFVETSGLGRGAGGWDAAGKSSDAAHISETDLGFGVLRYRVARPGGYARAEIEVVQYMGLPVEYRASVSSSSWNEVGERIRQAWSKAGGGAFEQTANALFRHGVFEDRVVGLHEGMAAVLGRPVDVPVPDELRAEYDALRSPFAKLEVGRSCGIAGRRPRGRALIDRLVRENRADLLANILRGLNPEGRVYALLGLRELERRHGPLEDGLHVAMKTVLTSDLPIRFCNGCIIQQRPCAEGVGKPR